MHASLSVRDMRIGCKSFTPPFAGGTNDGIPGQQPDQTREWQRAQSNTGHVSLSRRNVGSVSTAAPGESPKFFCDTLLREGGSVEVSMGHAIFECPGISPYAVKDYRESPCSTVLKVFCEATSNARFLPGE